jgi:hypothetical protein
MSWEDVVRSRLLKWCVWVPHSLRTAEVTGSIPVTPTGQNASQARTTGRLPEDLPEDRGLRVVASGQRRSIRAAGKP